MGTTWSIKADPAIGADLYLIDGNNHARRAFHAYPEELTAPDGETPTGAIYGLSHLLHRLRTQFGMRRGVVCWDLPGGTHRHQLYDGYKSKRSAMPELLARQWPLLQEAVEAYGLVNAELARYEADDLIGTLARQAAARGQRVCIVTSDKDAWQLIDDQIVVLCSSHKGELITMTADKVQERLGVSPMQMTDFVGLKGDPSDEIPGVPGIGEKTAAELIQAFGSLEAVLVRVDEVSGTVRKQRLEANAAQARLSKRLATIDCEVPLTCDVDGGQLNPDRLAEFLERLGMRNLRQRLEEIVPGVPAATAAAAVPTLAPKPAPTPAPEPTPQELGRLF